MNGKIRGQYVANYGRRDDVKETFWSTETTGLTNVGIFLCNFRCRWGHHKTQSKRSYHDGCEYWYSRASRIGGKNV